MQPLLLHHALLCLQVGLQVAGVAVCAVHGVAAGLTSLPAAVPGTPPDSTRPCLAAASALALALASTLACTLA